MHFIKQTISNFWEKGWILFREFFERNIVYFILFTGNDHFNFWNTTFDIGDWSMFLSMVLFLYTKTCFWKKICYTIRVNSTCMLMYIDTYYQIWYYTYFLISNSRNLIIVFYETIWFIHDIVVHCTPRHEFNIWFLSLAMTI